jgi:hypothetical protein
MRGIEIGHFEQHVGGRSEQPECSPPMMPPMSCTPASSAITVMNGWSTYSAVERDDGFAFARQPGGDGAGQLGRS